MIFISENQSYQLSWWAKKKLEFISNTWFYTKSPAFLEGQFSGKKECDRILTVGKKRNRAQFKKGGHLLPFFVELMLDF